MSRCLLRAVEQLARSKYGLNCRGCCWCCWCCWCWCCCYWCCYWCCCGCCSAVWLLLLFLLPLIYRFSCPLSVPCPAWPLTSSRVPIFDAAVLSGLVWSCVVRFLGGFRQRVTGETVRRSGSCQCPRSVVSDPLLPASWDWLGAHAQ